MDLETTGSSFKDGDRIIQIGIVIIQNNKIVQTYDTEINPLKKIPVSIQQITGITNRMVAKAPYFDDVAGYISNLLDGCVFVAHNILFDYHFLNYELKRAGLPEMNLKGIDTVQLAQILLPNMSTYSLGDLTQTLGIELKQAHDALSDAHATAELYLLLKERASDLPIVTLEELIRLSTYTVMDTHLFFDWAIKEAKQNLNDLPDDLFIQDKIAFRKVTQATMEKRNHSEFLFPESKEEKRALYQDQKDYRENQAQLMNLVSDYLSEEDTDAHLAIEAPAGVGKTFGYLLPASYDNPSFSPIVISTYTILLQQQIIEKEMAGLQAILPFPVTFAVLKSGYHYIDIGKWKTILRRNELETAEALYSMRVLVWLTQTQTGDLDELNIQNDLHRFWENIRYKTKTETKNESGFEVDYYAISREKAAQATFIITNHSFLSHQLMKEQSDFPVFDQLIIDEAHRFSDVAQQTATKTFHYPFLASKLKTLGLHKNEQALWNMLYKEIEEELSMDAKWKLMDQMFVYVKEELKSFTEEILYFFEQANIDYSDTNALPFSPKEFNVNVKKQLKNTLISLEEYTSVGFSILEKVTDLKKRHSDIVRSLLDELFSTLTTIDEQRAVLRSMLLYEENEEELYWGRYQSDVGIDSLSIHFYDHAEKNEVLKKIKRIKKVIYLSGTLSVNGSFDYFKDMMGNAQIKHEQIESEYRYDERTKIYVPSDISAINHISTTEHARIISEAVISFAQKLDKNMMVLFTSHEVLKKTHEYLAHASALKGRELFAQSITGSKEKITKRFFRSQGGILLGAETFWEGIDMPGNALQIVMVTRLPFEFPNRPLVQARHARLKKQGLNPFTVDSLPRTAMRLKQSYGRLLRSHEDKGVFVLMDQRIYTAAYGGYLQKSFPGNQRLEILPMEQIKEESVQFLNNQE